MTKLREAVMETVYITYAGNHLAIDIESPELLADVIRIFGKLINSDPQDVFHTLRVRDTTDGFFIEGTTEMEPHADIRRTALQHLKFEIIHQFINKTPGQLWIHAAAASLHGKGVLLSGAWGKGKSTIVSELCALGALYLSDDIVPIDMETGQLMPFHLTPMRREYEHAEAVLSPVEVSNLSKRIIPLDEQHYADTGVELAAIVFPEYTPSATTALESHSPAMATLTLLENCLNLKSKKGEAVHYLGQQIEKTPVFKLPYSNGPEGARLIADLVSGANS